MNLDTLQINLILAVKENPDLWHAIDESQPQVEKLWLELSKKFESSGIQIASRTLRYHWKALRDAYDTHLSHKHKNMDCQSFRFEKEMSFLHDHLLKPRQKSQINRRAILYDPEFLITEKDIEDTNDGEKITFIELPAKRPGFNVKTAFNGKLNFQNSKENAKLPNENKLQETTKKSLLRTIITKHQPIKYVGASIIRQQQQQLTSLGNSMKVTYLKEETNFVNNKNNNKECSKRAASDASTDSTFVIGSNLAEKRRRLQRSATRDAAETMLRLEAGVPSTSCETSTAAANSKENTESSFVYIIDDESYELDCTDETTKNKFQSSEFISMSQIVRNSLQQAADADEDLKFCEWIMSILKKMTNEDKNNAKILITNSFLNSSS